MPFADSRLMNCEREHRDGEGVRAVGCPASWLTYAPSGRAIIAVPPIKSAT
jgi:hypothetical protein